MSTAKIVYSTNGEDFDYHSVGEVFDKLEARGELRERITYFSAEAFIPKPSDFFRAKFLLDDIEERAYDNCGEWPNFTSQLTTAQREELQQLVSDWLDKHMTVNFWTVKDIKPLNVTAEDISERQQWKR